MPKTSTKRVVRVTPTRTANGQYRQKRADTLMKTIETKYGKDLGVRGDEKLGTYLKKK